MRIDGHSLAERPLPAVRHPASSRHGSDTGVPMIHLLGRITYHRLSTVDNGPEPGRRFDTAQAGPRGCCQPSSMQNDMSFVTNLACPQRLPSSKFSVPPSGLDQGRPRPRDGIRVDVDDEGRGIPVFPGPEVVVAP